VHYKTTVGGRPVFFDLRQISDGYYHEALEQDMLQNRSFSSKGFYILQGEYYYYTLMYHALLHKQEYSDEYRDRLSKMDMGNGTDITIEVAISQLANWLLQHEYPITRPFDSSVRFNPQIAAQFPRLLYWQTNEDKYRQQLLDCQQALAALQDEKQNLLARLEAYGYGSITAADAALRAHCVALEKTLAEIHSSASWRVMGIWRRLRGEKKES
jgi:hypothetical protein